MKIGNRIFYDNDGEIIYQTGEMQGDVLPRKEITKVEYIDLDFGTINHQTERIASIDVDTKQPIIEHIEVEKTPEQQRIEELEDELLLHAEKELGGIL